MIGFERRAGGMARHGLAANHFAGMAITRVDPRRDRRKVRKRLIELSGFDPLSARYRGFFFTGFFVARLSFFCSAASMIRCSGLGYTQ